MAYRLRPFAAEVAYASRPKNPSNKTSRDRVDFELAACL